MIADYCNEKAQWKHLTGNDEYGDPVYAPPVTIDCRIERKHRLVRDRQGNQVVSDSRIYTPSPVKCDDVVNDRVVIADEDIKDLDGNVEGYVVYL